MTKKPTGWAPPPGYIVLTRHWDGAKVLVPAAAPTLPRKTGEVQPNPKKRKRS